MKIYYKVGLLLLSFMNIANIAYAQVEEEHEDEHDEESIVLTVEQMENAGIRVDALYPAILHYQVYAPGDVKANDYTSYIVSPRIDSIIQRRYVALGDHIETGEILVTLFSEAVAEAQASYLVASSERQRVIQLGRQAVGESRFISAQTDYDVAYGRLRAFGLTDTDITRLSEEVVNLGEYSLRAETDGAVLSDDFRQGQFVEAGHALIELADEQSLWVEARLAPSLRLNLPAGTEAEIVVEGITYNGIVSQEAHTIDPITRTRVIRLLVNNEEDQLHPGLFADVYFPLPTDEPVMAVPEDALIRGGDGDWTIFVEHEPGEFEAQEVELGRSLGELREIEGVAVGTRVVMQGAFFISSEAAKGGFDIHNH
tara:strand:+ start:4738 stop:5847 length:1110 start_codon:yes stop_codon:yes gene_type:complete